MAVARRICDSGARFCPHYLGGGIGLLASAHLLAASGGGGLLEIDANPNPLRSLVRGPLGDILDSPEVELAYGRYSLSSIGWMDGPFAVVGRLA